MFCVMCGTENLDLGTFCRHCGKPLVKYGDLSHSPSFTVPKPEIQILSHESSDTSMTIESQLTLLEGSLGVASNHDYARRTRD